MASSSNSRLRLALTGALWAAAGLTAAAVALRTPADLDTGWNLRTGQEIWRSGALLDADPFLHSSSQPLPPQLDGLLAEVTPQRLAYPLRSHWLGQLAMFGLWSAAGDSGLRLFTLMLWLLLLLALWWAARLLELPPPWRPLLLLIAIDGLVLYIVARPALFSLLGIAGSLLLWLQLWRQRRLRWGWLAVALLPLWAQLHGGFIYGIALAELWVTGLLIDRLRPRPGEPLDPFGWPSLLALGGTALVLPLALNPTGAVDYLTSLIAFLSTAKDFLPSEYQRPDLWWNRQYWIFAALALLLLPLIWRRFPSAFALLVGSGIVLGALARRNVVLFMLAALPLALAGASALLKTRAASRPPTSSDGDAAPFWVAGLIGAAIVADFFVATPDLGWRPAAIWPNALPARLAGIVRDDPPPGLPYNDPDLGGYLIWQVPEVRWFTDGRNLSPRLDAALYSWSRELPFDDGRQPVWRLLFEHYRVRWAVVFGFRQSERAIWLSEPLKSLIREPGWLPVDGGNGSILFVQQSAETAPYLARHPRSVADVQAVLLHLLQGGGTAALLASPEGWLDLSDLLLAAGRTGPLGPSELPAAEFLLQRIGPDQPQHAEAQRRLANWPAHALPAIDRLAALPGGESYAALAERLRMLEAASTTAPAGP